MAKLDLCERSSEPSSTASTNASATPLDSDVAWKVGSRSASRGRRSGEQVIRSTAPHHENATQSLHSGQLLVQDLLFQILKLKLSLKLHLKKTIVFHAGWKRPLVPAHLRFQWSKPINLEWLWLLLVLLLVLARMPYHSCSWPCRCAAAHTSFANSNTRSSPGKRRPRK